MEIGYKTKTIEKIIRGKIENWAKSITDESLRQKVLDDYIVTGGAITSLLLGEKPNDFDVYFHTTSVAKEVAEYYVQKVMEKQGSNNKIREPFVTELENSVKISIKSAGVLSDEFDNTSYNYFELVGPEAMMAFFKGKENEKVPYSVALITDNAISLNDDIQIIIRFCGNPEMIHQNFDYIHTTNYYTPSTGLVLNLDAVTATMSRTLTYVGSLYPICSLFRMRKFLNRGWRITGGEILKMAWDISKLDLTDISVLQEQLIGVDTAYFNQLIRILQNRDPALDFDRTYLYNLIDRIFDGEDLKE